MNDEGAGGVRGVGPVVFGFGVIVVRGPGTAGAGVGGEGVGRLLEVGVGLRENAIVVDGGDVGPGGRFGLGQEKAGSEKKCGGLGTEDAACGSHGGVRLSAEGYHDAG